MKHVGVGLGLVALWVALWGEVTPANVLGGIAIAAVVLVAAPLPRPLRGELVIHPIRVMVFAAFFLRELVEATAIVALAVVRRRSTTTSGIVAVPLSSDSDALTTIIANTVSLTPGTLTIEIDLHPPVLYIHVLHLTDIDQVLADVATLERQVTRAFGSATAIADVQSRRTGSAA